MAQRCTLVEAVLKLTMTSARAVISLAISFLSQVIQIPSFPGALQVIFNFSHRIKSPTASTVAAPEIDMP